MMRPHAEKRRPTQFASYPALPSRVPERKTKPFSSSGRNRGPAVIPRAAVRFARGHLFVGGVANIRLRGVGLVLIQSNASTARFSFRVCASSKTVRSVRCLSASTPRCSNRAMISRCLWMRTLPSAKSRRLSATIRTAWITYRIFRTFRIDGFF
jgi:hypothetical protein